MGDSYNRVRFPTLELFALRNQGLFADMGRPLTPKERELAQSIFGQSLNYDDIRIANTALAVNGRQYTLGNTIRIPTNTVIDSATLIHELTHVWQYQTKGGAYISDSLVQQGVQGQAAYNITIVPAQKFSGYHAEQEAMIVQNYYMKATIDESKDPNDPSNNWRTNGDVVRMIHEVQTARPFSNQQIEDEILGYPQNDPFRDLGPPDGANSRLPSVTPLIRWEFDF